MHYKVFRYILKYIIALGFQQDITFHELLLYRSCRFCTSTYSASTCSYKFYSTQYYLGMNIRPVGPDQTGEKLELDTDDFHISGSVFGFRFYQYSGFGFGSDRTRNKRYIHMLPVKPKLSSPTPPISLFYPPIGGLHHCSTQFPLL